MSRIRERLQRLEREAGGPVPKKQRGEVVIYRLGQPLPPAPPGAAFVLYVPDNYRGDERPAR